MLRPTLLRMGKEILVNVEKSITRIALVEDGALAELYLENAEHERTIGNIVLGKVKKIMPSIRAAFVDIGQKQDAFLHYSDLSDNLPQMLAFLEQHSPQVASFVVEGDRLVSRQKRKRLRWRKRVKKQATLFLSYDLSRKKPKPPVPTRKRQKAVKIPKYKTLEEYLQKDQRILVKIVKEPISTKGSRASSDISLAGRFLVLIPLASYVAVSKKIGSFKERRRLRSLARNITPPGYGVIVRTQAQGKDAKVLETDLRLLVERWRKIESKLQNKPRPPVTVYEDVNMVSSILRDLFSDDFDRILVDDVRTHRNIQSYVRAVAPDYGPKVQLFQGRKSIFDANGVARDIREAFESRVSMPSGGYLFIERTEAMHVVDVNSGRAGKGFSHEENALRINLEAARIICRQVRLRDLGGIIVIDFIDLREDKNRKKVFEEIKKEFRKDRAVTKVLPMSDFGLIEITRQRLRPALTTYATADMAAPPTLSDDEADEVMEQAEALLANEMEQVALLPAEISQELTSRPARTRPPRRRDTTPEELVDRIQAMVQRHREGGGQGPLLLRVHPFLAAYMHKKFPGLPTRWAIRYRMRIRLEEDHTLSPFKCQVMNGTTGEDLTELLLPPRLPELPSADPAVPTSESSPETR